MIKRTFIGDIDVTDMICSDFGSQEIRAAHTVERVRSYMETHLGCSAKEIAYALDLSGDQARRAVRKIRGEWAGA